MMSLERTHSLLSDILVYNGTDLHLDFPKFLESKINSIIKGNIPVEFLSDYIHWNSVFAGCVVNLVSRYHLWPYIGEKPSPGKDLEWYKVVSSLGNRHFHKVASYIFAAAEDEYNDKGIKVKDERVSHKDMAWFFLNETFNYLDLDIRSRKVSSFAEEMNKQTMHGYGVGQPDCIEFLFENLGFHLGSEKLASIEFQIINDSIRKHHPSLYEHLASKEMSNGIKAIDWVRVHGIVEEEHFNNAVMGVQIIHDHIHENISAHRFSESILDGFRKFANLQKAFFNFY